MYKFNGGAGAVICDKCRIMIDEGIGWKEYEASYAKSRDANRGKDLCWRCKASGKRKRPVAAK